MPPPGYGQSLCVYKHRLILFGGTCGSFFYNHLFEYDTKEQVGRRDGVEGRKGGREGGGRKHALLTQASAVVFFQKLTRVSPIPSLHPSLPPSLRY